MRAYLVVMLFPLLSGCGSPPCTKCPPIAGDYRMIFQAVSVDKSSCKNIWSEGASGAIHVGQSGSRITLDPLGLTGTLNEDNSLEFDAFPTVFGNNGAAAHETLTGDVTIDGGRTTFSGTMKIVEDGTNCFVNIPTSWEP